VRDLNSYPPEQKDSTPSLNDGQDQIVTPSTLSSLGSPSTFVQVEGPLRGWSQPGFSLLKHRERPTDVRTASALRAVLLAAAEQVSSRKMAAVNVQSRLDMTLLALAMAFRGDDTGLAGDVFEWSVLTAINSGDSEVTGLVSDALRLVGHPNQNPQAVLVAAESGRLVNYSPSLPAAATLATGNRGRQPLISNILRDATTTSWKADLLLGSEDRWVAASLKTNPKDLRPSLGHATATTRYAPRIAITASQPHQSGLIRDRETGAVVITVRSR